MLSFKKAPWTGLVVALLSIPALMIFSAVKRVGLDNEAEIAKTMWQEGIIVANFLAAAIIITFLQHKWPAISRFLDQLPRSPYWGRGIMCMSLFILPFLPCRVEPDGEPTATSTFIGFAVIGGFILLGFIVNFIQYPQECKAWLKDMFSAE
ncbi:MAG: hypothetical protein WC610_02955 [Patescibacteria group bacterium]